jgi:hypothetical protein
MPGGGEIEDAEATVPEAHLTGFVEARIIRTAIGDEVAHPPNEIEVADPDCSDNSAHGCRYERGVFGEGRALVIAQQFLLTLSSSLSQFDERRVRSRFEGQQHLRCRKPQGWSRESRTKSGNADQRVRQVERNNQHRRREPPLSTDEAEKAKVWNQECRQRDGGSGSKPRV